MAEKNETPAVDEQKKKGMELLNQISRSAIAVIDTVTYSFYTNNTGPIKIQVKADFGITKVEYNELLEKQKGVCALCPATDSGDGRPLFVDHCHETGRVRGLLCKQCNTAIGLLGDNLAG